MSKQRANPISSVQRHQRQELLKGTENILSSSRPDTEEDLNPDSRLKKLINRGQLQETDQDKPNAPVNMHTFLKKSQIRNKKGGPNMNLPTKQNNVNFITLNLTIVNPLPQLPTGQLPVAYPAFKNYPIQVLDNSTSLQDILQLRKKKKPTPMQQQQQLIQDQLAAAAGKLLDKKQFSTGSGKNNAIFHSENALGTEIAEDNNLSKRPRFDSKCDQPNVDSTKNASNASNLTVSVSNKPKNLLKYGNTIGFQVQDIIPIIEDCENIKRRDSKSPSSRAGGQNIIGMFDMYPKMSCNHKVKYPKESQAGSLSQNGLYHSKQNGIYNMIDKSPKTEEQITVLDVKAAKNESIERANRYVKAKGAIDRRQLEVYENQEDSQRGVYSLEKQDDSSILVSQKQKQYQQQQLQPLLPNKSLNMSEGRSFGVVQQVGNVNGYNGLRNEPSSHQFIALKPAEIEELRIRNLKQRENEQMINQDTSFAGANKETRFIQQRHSLLPTIQPQHYRGTSQNNNEKNRNSVGSSVTSVSSDLAVFLQQSGSDQVYQNQREMPSTIRSQQIININSPDQASSKLNDQEQITYLQDQLTQQQMTISDSKKPARKIINATANRQEAPKRLEGEKRNSIANILKPKNQMTNSSNSQGLVTMQQKERNQKSEKDIILSQKIKLYLDFSRVINFSNNMTMLPAPTSQGTKIYRAFITKGNNGVLIRAALKNRWWWSLSETGDDYDSIQFLWTQWRKPNFFKQLKTRAELAVKEETITKIQTIMDQELEIETQGKRNPSLASCVPKSSSKEDEKDPNFVEEEEKTEVEQQQQLSSDEGITPTGSDFTRETQNEDESLIKTNLDQKQTNEIHLARVGYNEDPLKSLSDYLVKPQSKLSKGAQQLLPSPNPGQRKISLTSVDPFSKISALVNESDLKIIKKYIKTQKARKSLPNGYSPPPIFNKEEFNDIEKTYEQMRNEFGNNKEISTTATVFNLPVKQKISNHMEFNFHLANKKALFYNMKQYYQITGQDVFQHLPVTFHIQNGLNDPEFTNFVNYYSSYESENPKRKNVWIIKPGESSNRGNGIQVAGDVNSVRDIIKVRESHQNGFKKTYIIQRYLDKPFLYNKRKFDIRCFMLMTNYNNTLKAYWYQEGYIRTSTKEFTLKNLENRMIHLTNEAVQKRGEDFGKFENGNKLSYQEFQKYIDATYPKENFNFMQTIYPAMKKLAYDSVCSVFTKIDKKKRNFSFELFGLDFMIDDSFKTWLIEINTNPSLTIAAPLMSRLLPGLIDNVLKIAIDPIFPPPNFPKSKKNLIPEQIYENNKFDLLFDSALESDRITKLYQNISLKSNIVASLDWICFNRTFEYGSIKVDEQLEEDCKNEEVYDDDDVDRDDEGGDDDEDDNNNEEEE